MKIFGFEIARIKAAAPTTTPIAWDFNMGVPFWGSSIGFPVIQEPFTGAWQKNAEVRANTLMSFPALYRCIAMISQDISKMRIRLMEQVASGIWNEVNRNSPYWPVLIKPNRYQTRIQFFDEWMGSKLIQGNTYALKERDSRGIVTDLYILNPWRCKPLVATDGSVWYDLQPDNLANVSEGVRVPASEVIHDRYKPLYHPLCGISPVAACALSGALGLAIAQNAANFFQNSSRPGGILSAPDRINDETAARLKKHWEDNYTGVNAGRIAVLGDGLKFEAIRENAQDAQLVEQLKLSGEQVCTAFGVPSFMVGIGTVPAYNNVEALAQQYYSQCLQNLIESIEILMDEGLGLTAVTQHVYGTEFDLSELLRMDTATKSKTWGDLVKGSIAAPNEARAAFDLPPVAGGDSVFMQQQNFSLEALAGRSAPLDASSAAPAQPASDGTPAEGNNTDGTNANYFAERITKYAQREARRLRV